MEHETKIIYSQRLAGYLMLRGFVLMGMDQDRRIDGRNVFFFKNSPKLDDAIMEYSLR